MSDVSFYNRTESEILALKPSDKDWEELAFYYPSDIGIEYFYQINGGVLRAIGKKAQQGIGVGVGCKINGVVIGGVKSNIQQGELLDIPEFYEYNIFLLSINGNVNCSGDINIM